MLGSAVSREGLVVNSELSNTLASNGLSNSQEWLVDECAKDFDGSETTEEFIPEDPTLYE